MSIYIHIYKVKHIPILTYTVTDLFATLCILNYFVKTLTGKQVTLHVCTYQMTNYPPCHDKMTNKCSTMETACTIYLCVWVCVNS